MASRFANNDAQRSLKRINGDIAVDKQDHKDFLNIAKAHMAAGNAGDAVTVLTALGRLDERTDVREAVKEQNAEDRKVLLAQIDKKLGIEVQSEPEIVPSWAKELIGRVKSLEKA